MNAASRADAALMFVAATTCGLVLFGILASGHGVNPDEGFYLAGAWRVLQGEAIYRDFFFPQMPYLPFVQALLIGAAGTSLLVSRLVSVVPGALGAGLLAWAAWRWSGRREVTAVVVIAYLGHVLFWNYLTVTKTYGWANAWLLAAFLLLSEGRRYHHGLLAGLCGGLAVGARLPAIAAVAVLFAWQSWRDPRGALWFALGALVALLPCAWIAARDPQAFWFGNYGFHSLRREIVGTLPILKQKLSILRRWLSLPQNLVLWIAAALGWWTARRASGPGVPDASYERTVAALACVGAMGVAYLAATPTYLEYTVQLIPFLLLSAVGWLNAGKLYAPTKVLLAVVYAVGLVIALRPAGEQSYRGKKLELWRLDAVEEVASYLHQQSGDGDQILSWWEGYPVLAGRAGFTGVGFWESNVAKKLTNAERQLYHVLDREEIVGLVRERKPRLVIFPAGVWQQLADGIAEHYQPAAQFGALQIYRRS